MYEAEKNPSNSHIFPMHSTKFTNLITLANSTQISEISHIFLEYVKFPTNHTFHRNFHISTWEFPSGNLTCMLVFCTDSAIIFHQPPSSLLRNGERWRRRKRHWHNSERVSPGVHSSRQPAVPAHWTGGEVPGRVPPPIPSPLLGQFEAAAADLQDSL